MTPLIINTIPVPQPPYLTNDPVQNISAIRDYLGNLCDYFYSCDVSINTDSISTDLITAVVQKTVTTQLGFNVTAAIGWGPTVTTIGFVLFRIPDDYANGNLTLTLARAGDAAGTADMDWRVFRFRDGIALTTPVALTDIDFTPGDTNTHYITLTIPGATFTIGDYLRIDIIRNAVDTMVGNVGYRGTSISYSAYAVTL